MRNNKCRKYLTFTTIILLLGLIVVPNVNASIMKISSDKEPYSIGSIYGRTGYVKGWGVYGLQFVLVKAEDGDAVIGKDRSNIFCQYKISRLPIGYTYTVTASSDALIEKDGKYYGFYDRTETITLTEDKPNVEIYFTLEINYDDPVKDKKEDKSVDKLSVDQTIQRIFQRFPIIEKLFPLTSLSSNARSNFLSTTAFMS